MASAAVPSANRLRDIKTFPSLVKYLHEELDWPVGRDSFDDLTYDFELEELGIDPKNSAKIQSIKQLRKFVDDQPWGIFFIKFEPKSLPIVALRRILSGLVIKRRRTGGTDRAEWQLHDLLFISSYGDSDHTEMTFAHFSEEPELGDLPTLRVLGWDEDNAADRLKHTDSVLRQKLCWPKDDRDLDSWRSQWSEAFSLRPGEVIRTAQAMAERLAELATKIRKRVTEVLRFENERGQMRSLYDAFKQALIHDLSLDDFADMYAQTICYGLLTARFSRPAGLIADNLKDMVPPSTNPFLRELLGTFLKIGGRKDKLDFDELGITEVVQILRLAKMEEVKRDFFERNPDEDPTIRFYEDFLEQYDPKKRTQRGVFYTPQPVVSYIVRNVHELLQTEFGLSEGLASTATWGEMSKQHPGLKIPQGTRGDSPFVQILDPAVGTGTFLVEVIDVVHQTMRHKWGKEGRLELEIPKLWNEYVSKHLLPRLHGYELMMAPYAIAHMKIGLKLGQTGYQFADDERARIYLTNSLEPASDDKRQRQFEEWAPALAHEARAVNIIKRQPFTVVIGNPPYANYGQLNKIPFILRLLDDYKRNLDEKKINLDDDFIKFVRFSQYLIEESGAGIHGMITNNAYLDGLTHRRMRHQLMETFSRMQIVNLHGSSKKKEKSPDGTVDENVFDITVGVAIGVFVREPRQAQSSVAYADCWGTRETKTKSLSAARYKMRWVALKPVPENFFLAPKDFSSDEEYQSGWSLGDIFNVWQNGLKTDRDDLFFDCRRDVLEKRMRQFYEPKLDAEFRRLYNVAASSSYDIEARRRATSFAVSNIRLCLYRPMDLRWLYYDPNLTSRPAEKVMKHMIAGPNLGLIATRQTQDKWDSLVTNHLCGHKSCAAYDINSLFPLYLYEETLDLRQASSRKGGAPDAQRLNLADAFLRDLGLRLKLAQSREHGLPGDLTPEDIFHYAYAVFYSPGYRSRYAEFLKIDFPRLPLTGDLDLFRKMARFGGELIALHLLQSPKLDQRFIKIIGTERPVVGKVSYENKTVWIDKDHVCGFEGVSEAVWAFHIGGYQVCEKWLKDRKDSKLLKDDIDHYQRIIVAVAETIRLMEAIDALIDKHGGWPDAFSFKSLGPARAIEARA